MWFILGPLDTSGAGVSPSSQGYGAGVGPSGEQGVEQGERQGERQGTHAAAAPVPQYWLADASLFVANAGNAAQTLANEQALGIQAPSVLGNQAQFLLGSIERSISSLSALQANAEATNPRVVSDIRAALDQLVAAKGQAQQAMDAANAGALGPKQQAAIRSTYEHLQAAERDMGAVGRGFGIQGYTLASTCGFRGGQHGFGAGIGGKGGPGQPKERGAPPVKNAPAPGAPQNAPNQAPVEPGTQP
jgi:hypothetical protein